MTTARFRPAQGDILAGEQIADVLAAYEGTDGRKYADLRIFEEQRNGVLVVDSLDALPDNVDPLGAFAVLDDSITAETIAPPPAPPVGTVTGTLAEDVVVDATTTIPAGTEVQVEAANVGVADNLSQAVA